MENHSKEGLFFSIRTPYQPDVIEMQKSNFLREKTKHFSIFQGESMIMKLHSHILEEEEFELTFAMFESNVLSLPIEYNPVYVEVIVKYFYFKEIKPIPLSEVFHLLKLTFYLKVEQVTLKILEFLSNSLKNIESASFIYEQSLDFIFFFQEGGRQTISQIFEGSIRFLIRNEFYEEFLCVFNTEFFKNMNDSVEEMFYWLLSLLKKSNVSNEWIIKFIIVFKQNLIAQIKMKNPGFSKESYFRKIIEDNLDLTKINIKETFNELDLDENFETQDFLIKVLSENQKKITQIVEENLVFKSDLEEAKKNIQILKESTRI